MVINTTMIGDTGSTYNRNEIENDVRDLAQQVEQQLDELDIGAYINLGVVSFSWPDRYQALADLVNYPHSEIGSYFQDKCRRKEMISIHDPTSGWGHAIKEFVFSLPTSNLWLTLTDLRNPHEMINDVDNDGNGMPELLYSQKYRKIDISQRNAFDIEGLPFVDLVVLGFAHPYIATKEEFSTLIALHLLRAKFVAIAPGTTAGEYEDVRDVLIFENTPEDKIRSYYYRIDR